MAGVVPAVESDVLVNGAAAEADVVGRAAEVMNAVGELEALLDGLGEGGVALAGGDLSLLDVADHLSVNEGGADGEGAMLPIETPAAVERVGGGAGREVVSAGAAGEGIGDAGAADDVVAALAAIDLRI